MRYAEIQTWADLKNALETATEEQLKQPVQTVAAHPDEGYVLPCKEGIIIGTVDELELLYCRSVTDNKRHGEELVIFTDGNPHAEDGATSYLMGEIKPDEDWSDSFAPEYPSNHCPDADWVTGTAKDSANKAQMERDVGKGTFDAVIQKRLKKLD